MADLPRFSDHEQSSSAAVDMPAAVVALTDQLEAEVADEAMQLLREKAPAVLQALSRDQVDLVKGAVTLGMGATLNVLQGRRMLRVPRS